MDKANLFEAQRELLAKRKGRVVYRELSREILPSIAAYAQASFAWSGALPQDADLAQKLDALMRQRADLIGEISLSLPKNITVCSGARVHTRKNGTAPRPPQILGSTVAYIKIGKKHHQNPSAILLKKHGVIGMKSSWSAIKKIEQKVNDFWTDFKRLSQACDHIPHALKRAFGQTGSGVFYWPPGLAQQVRDCHFRSLDWSHVAGPFSPLPCFFWHTIRAKLCQIGDALRCYVGIMNNAYNLRRRETGHGSAKRKQYRGLKFILTLVNSISWNLPKLTWAAQITRPTGGVYFSHIVTKYSNKGGVRSLLPSAHKVNTPHGGLNPIAVSYANQPEMYRLYAPIDRAKSIYNELISKLTASAAQVFGEKNSVSSHPINPRNTWVYDTPVDHMKNIISHNFQKIKPEPLRVLQKKRGVTGGLFDANPHEIKALEI